MPLLTTSFLLNDSLSVHTIALGGSGNVTENYNPSLGIELGLIYYSQNLNS